MGFWLFTTLQVVLRLKPFQSTLITFYELKTLIHFQCARILEITCNLTQGLLLETKLIWIQKDK